MEHKFKVWCKNKNEWEKHFVVMSPDGLLLHLNNNLISPEFTPLNPKTHIAVFSTGKHDKNGKEIFLGDIVKTKSPFEDDDVDYFGEIVYRNDWTAFGCFHIDPSPLAKDGEKIWTSCGDFREVEIIGNRFENGELLS